MVERLSQANRPVGRAVGFQNWRSLLFLHWPVPTEAMRHVVPPQLSLDLHEGVAYVGVVPFIMKDVRPRWLPQRFSFSFLETNVRTYVHDGQRAGVYFFSLDASSRLAVWAARAGWSLPYYFADMQIEEYGGQVHYKTQRVKSNESFFVQYEIREPIGISQPGTLEHFLLERYLLFAQRRDKIFVGQVHHTPYPVHAAEVGELCDELVGAAGLPNTDARPAFAHYSPGVDVEVFALKESVL